MDKETIALVATLVGLAVTLAGLATTWFWRKHGQPASVKVARSSVTPDGDIKGNVFFAEPGATVNVYVDGLPRAGAPVRDPFEEGRRLQSAEQHESAIAEFEKAFAAAENDSQRCALHILIGNSFLTLTRIVQAESEYRQALDVAERSGDRKGAARALGNLGLIYRRIGKLAKARAYHEKALRIDQDIGNKPGQGSTLGNLGLVYRQQGDLDKAEEYHKKSLELHREIGNRLA